MSRLARHSTQGSNKGSTQRPVKSSVRRPLAQLSTTQCSTTQCSTRRFLCVTIPDFPVWAALQSDAALSAAAATGREILIYSSGHIVSASAGARRAGVQNGWTLQRAQSLSLDAISLARSASTERAAWQSVLRTLYEVTPYMESIRPGLVLLNIEPPSAVFAFLRSTCIHEYAHDGAHGGIADDRTTAELTAYSAKAGTLRVLKSTRGHSFLYSVPVDTLAQVGVRLETMQRLHWFGWHHVGDLRAATRQQLVQQFPEGEILYRYSQAKDVRPIRWYSPPPTVQAVFTWEEAVREPAEVEPVLEMLLQRAVADLNGRSTQEITIKVEGREGFSSDHRLLRGPLTELRALRIVARHVLKGALRRDMWIQQLHVELGSLAQPQAHQGRLFGRERPCVQAALQAVERRFPGGIRRFRVQDAHAYLPERFARLEPLS